MELASILKPDAVKFISAASSKKRLFQELAEIGGGVYDICPKKTVEALQERESLGPTGVGLGIALPHARVTDLDHIAGVFVRLEKTLEFDAVDRRPVDLVFALFAPENSGVDHLKALALVSRTMRDPAICGKLRSNNSASTLHAILTEAPAIKAA
ncbi:PTS sugar transporter subunit IIA [Actibacterium sp. 188UL27-1]|uniref:PTS sugar transporter subunit IIA n=1 Tax=Actibacterium sp. 188UL27-1 TaxID=2786961 RepID=UPI00195A8D03|nr:PTS sugar transporter subunit IIA [Actibacterium sp. 188UL27-1]MBM7067139.1 PTS sugar transporter subunit IIA [Actibacterium sp. 188UL27-1]